jgi:hypothetical protein
MADEERPMAGIPDEEGEPSDADYQLGLLWSFGSALVVASPGSILVGKDLRLVLRRRWLETKIFELEALAVEEGGRVPKLPGGLDGDQDAVT